MSVITFRPRQPEPDPCMTGPARCMCCGREWQAVAPTGVLFLECPECHTEKGVFVGACWPEEGTEVRECNCGNQLFVLTREGHLCPNCGTYQRYD